MMLPPQLHPHSFSTHLIPPPPRPNPPRTNPRAARTNTMLWLRVASLESTLLGLSLRPRSVVSVVPSSTVFTTTRKPSTSSMFMQPT
jgi:hypothetical protein